MKNLEKPGIEVSEKEAAELSIAAGRGLNEYERFLRITEEDLSGKEILDLGSGPETKFAKETEEKLPGTKVVSFDFSFLRPSNNKSEIESQQKEKDDEKSKTIKSVSGFFTALPFKDETFDLVVSSAAMPLYLNNRNQIVKAFEELVRVLKKGGRAYLSPVTYTDIYRYRF